MADYSKFASIMWPVPVTRRTPEGSHVTAIFLGEIDKLNVQPSDITKALSSYGHLDQGFVLSNKIEIFGDVEKFLVLTLKTHNSALISQRNRMLDRLTATLGLRDASSFPDYRPHMTLGKTADPDGVPSVMYLEAPQLWWGGVRYNLV